MLMIYNKIMIDETDDNAYIATYVADKIDEALAFAEKDNLTVIPTFDRLLKK